MVIQMKLKFYGTRGSLPAPGAETVKYGGNTTCLEITTKQGEEYIFDAGSGIRQLGLDLMKKGVKKAKLFVTHDHWDHIQGFPFFVPAYVPGNEIDIYSGDKEVITDLKTVQERQDGVAKNLEDKVATNKDEKENYTKSVFEGQQNRDRGYFPIEIKDMAATLRYIDLAEDEVVENGFKISYKVLNHPQGVYCYKIEENGSKVVFATDYEHDGLQNNSNEFGEYDKKLIDWAKDAEVLIIDGQYTPEEYETKKGC